MFVAKENKKRYMQMYSSAEMNELQNDLISKVQSIETDSQVYPIMVLSKNSSNKKIFRHKPKTMKQKGMVAPIQAKSGNDY